MVSAFAVLAVILAMVGVFGILAYSVQQRVRDFESAARWAPPRTTSRLVVTTLRSRSGPRLPGRVGMLGRMIVSMLFGVQPLDLETFAFVTVVLGLTARSQLPAGVESVADRSNSGVAIEVAADFGTPAVESQP
jgi:putative ABC transport system permease protein